MKEIYAPKGIVPVPPTPFDKDDKINYKVYEDIMNFLIDAGVHAITIGGSTGEFSTMTVEERMTLFEYAGKAIAGRVPMVCHTSGHTTKETLKLSEHAVKCGAKANMILTPYYLKPGSAATYDFFKTIADALPETGIAIYNVPGNTNVDIPITDCWKLANEIPQVNSIKDSTTLDHSCFLMLGTTGTMGTNKNVQFEVGTGRECTVFAHIAQGGAGCYGVVSVAVPKEHVKMYDLLVNQNNWKAALEVDRSIREVAWWLESETNPGPMKAALDILGFDIGVPRLPVRPASEKCREGLRNVYRRLGYKVVR